MLSNGSIKVNRISIILLLSSTDKVLSIIYLTALTSSLTSSYLIILFKAVILMTLKHLQILAIGEF